MGMISYIRGKLVEKSPTHIVVESGGMGFWLGIPLSSFTLFGNVGEEICVLTHFHVREDALQLFGFATKEERDLFRLLISISGIGPRLAQGILSGMSVDMFTRAILDEDLSSLSRISGVGKRTAERLVLELRGKLGEKSTEESAVPVFATSPAGEEAVLALVSLGYKRARASDVIQKLLQDDKSLPVEALIRRALRKI
jgi:Holliday junction DNA helicase RuvA